MTKTTKYELKTDTKIIIQDATTGHICITRFDSVVSAQKVADCMNADRFSKQHGYYYKVMREVINYRGGLMIGCYLEEV